MLADKSNRLRVTILATPGWSSVIDTWSLHEPDVTIFLYFSWCDIFWRCSFQSALCHTLISKFFFFFQGLETLAFALIHTDAERLLQHTSTFPAFNEGYGSSRWCLIGLISIGFSVNLFSCVWCVRVGFAIINLAWFV